MGSNVENSAIFRLLTDIQGDVTDIKVNVSELKTEMPHKVGDKEFAETLIKEFNMHNMAHHTTKSGGEKKDTGFFAAVFGGMSAWQKTILLVAVILSLMGNGKLVLETLIGG